MACEKTMGSLNFVRLGSDVLVRFSDINDAINSYNLILLMQLEWSVEFITPAAFAEVCIALKLSVPILMLIIYRKLIHSLLS